MGPKQRASFFTSYTDLVYLQNVFKMYKKLPDSFGQVSETEPSPCKILLFVFPQSGAKIRAN